MKQKLGILVLLVLVAALLIGLGAASYRETEKQPDSELLPNRSSFNAGATGTQAFFTLLAETGRRPIRWQEPPAALITAGQNAPSVFVITGDLRRPITDPERDDLLRWVSEGGRLVVIDRFPDESLLTTTSNWKLSSSASPANSDLFKVDPYDQRQLTGNTAAAKPAQPSVITDDINAIQPSRFASSINFERSAEARTDTPVDDEQSDAGPPPTASPSEVAPIVHFESGGKNLVVEARYGQGRIYFLSDPYIVANTGISLVDNAQLGANLVSGGGVIAFDEFHQGYGLDSNRFLQFFAGTPVVAIFLQLVFIAGVVFYSQSRRFARPVPEAEPDRLSKLEYVAAMAELQSRTKAFDLAVENIYMDTKRRIARLLGRDLMSLKPQEMAAGVAHRTEMSEAELYDLFFRCEEIIRGEPAKGRQTLALVERLRAVEVSLGISKTDLSKRRSVA